MACVDSFPQFDDESFALALQLEEIEAQRELQSGKWLDHNPPDFVLAFDDFEAELRKAIFLMKDIKFAHSIAKAVDSDALVIEELRLEETQASRDRGFAQSLNGDDENLQYEDVANSHELSGHVTESIAWDHVLRATEASTFSSESCSTVAGPSTLYALRQKAVLDHLPLLKVECSVCGDPVHPHFAVRLACNDLFCKACLKDFVLRVAKNEAIFPPKCHGQLIDISTIETYLSVEELATYRRAELEYTSTDRIYCANPECARFIPMSQRTGDYASCVFCGTETCIHCKAKVHDGKCQADVGDQELINVANEQRWKACFNCGRIVSRDEGCNHMM